MTDKRSPLSDRIFMLLHTPLYLFFLAFTVVIYWGLPKQNWRLFFLLFASYIFYSLFDWRFSVLLIALSITTYLIGKAIPHSRKAKTLVWLSVGVNLGTLGIFKYLDFFMGGLSSALHTLGLEALPSGLSLILPIGISFYTFQAISYTTEISRKKLEPAKNFWDFALYMAFFPKLIAGPLIRPARFLTQLQAEKSVFSRERFAPAMQLLLLGLFKKIIIADGLASLADTAFRAADFPSGYLSFPSPLYIQGFYLYAFQIYADFSGYTDIARASALLLGFDLPENFQQPYLSATLNTFWNRWHMSLTQWFREYMFFSLSRSLLNATRRAYPRGVQISVTLITMTVIGFWHGAAWTFIAWGFWHGMLLSIEQVSNLKPARPWGMFLLGVLTFHLVGLGWVLFRSSSFLSALHFLQGLFAFRQMNWLPVYLPPVLLTAALVFAIDLIQGGRLPAAANRLGAWRPVLVIAVIVLLVSIMVINLAHGSDSRPFIYGQF